eukprot:TRINITY_DN35558_c0_g1_i1.p1 TRINITY_DN35558_c0_g1~~TRINITY_DN35558_c0_g1_i1.p1  ORF type:complete len:353 (+),score=111.75 TRINITY_DN35558_c0_g1_i1:66-1061(+)
MGPLRTALTEKLGIEHPIICGGMTNVGYAEFAAAVSNAGALGIITALTQPTPEDLRAEIRKCRQLTSKPFGVNLTVLPSLMPRPYDDYAKVIAEEKVTVLELAGANPAKYMPMMRANGVLVIQKSATVRHALSAERAGVDFIELAGMESSIAGRVSEDDVSLWTLVAKGLSKLKTPVIASGATGSGRQLAAALTMGAVGVTVGTRFLCTKEAPVKDGIKEALVAATELDTTIVLRTLNNATRVFKNTTSKKVLEAEAKKPGNFMAVAPFMAGAKAKRSFHQTGNAQDSVWSCGQSVGLIEDIPTCRELVQRLTDEAVGRLRASSGILQAKL